MVLDVGPDRPPIEGLSPEEVASLALSLRDLSLRDALIAWMCPGTLPATAFDHGVMAALEGELPRPVWARVRGGKRSSADREASVAGRRLRSRLEHLCRCLPPGESAPMLSVVGNLAWSLGDGAAARCALERALDLEPEYRLAQLLSRMVDLAIRPRTVSA
jgi:hypothetical protein